jgi:High-temperature-induced dauer-formation protein
LISRLEVFNNIILHNLTDNPNLIYGMLRAHKLFEELGTFTLARGLREVRRVQLAREEHAQKGDAKGKSRAVSDVIGEEEEPQDEKARLLESEADSRRDSADVPVAAESRQQSLDEENSVSASPLMPPPISGDVNPASDLSEKARGKMRARGSLSNDMTRSLEQIAATGVGRNGFVPTQEWVSLSCIDLDDDSRKNSPHIAHPYRSLLGNKGMWYAQAREF